MLSNPKNFYGYIPIKIIQVLWYQMRDNVLSFMDELCFLAMLSTYWLPYLIHKIKIVLLLHFNMFKESIVT